MKVALSDFAEISAAVGDGKKPRVPNRPADQAKVIAMLWLLPKAQGGMDGEWTLPPVTRGDGTCDPAVVKAIRAFQSFWRIREKLTVDGIISPGGDAISKLIALCFEAEAEQIIVTSAGNAELASVNAVINPVISPVTSGGNFFEMSSTGRMQQFRLKVHKAGRVFWVGAAVPQGTVDFSRAHVFFHPTVVNGGSVHAFDRDYRMFTGGWSESLERYVQMQGGQMAAAGARVPLLVPFTTMTALTKHSKHNMFSDRPMETLNEILSALRSIATNSETAPSLTTRSISVSSFSSGIAALRMFVSTFGEHGIIREVTDFDSPFILHEPKVLTTSSGAISRVFTQHVLKTPPRGWVNMSPASLSGIKTFSDAHARIGWMTFFSATLSSAVR